MVDKNKKELIPRKWTQKYMELKDDFEDMASNSVNKEQQMEKRGEIILLLRNSSTNTSIAFCT